MFSICSHSFLSMSTKTIPECLMLNVLIRPECASILFDISSTQFLQSCNRTSFSGYNSNNCVFSARIRTRCRPETKTESSEHHFSWPQIKKRIQASEKCLVSNIWTLFAYCLNPTNTDFTAELVLASLRLFLLHDKCNFIHRSK